MPLNPVKSCGVLVYPGPGCICENNYSVYGCNFVKTVNIIDHKVGNWMIGMPVSVWPRLGNTRSSLPPGPVQTLSILSGVSIVLNISQKPPQCQAQGTTVSQARFVLTPFSTAQLHNFRIYNKQPKMP